MVQKNLIDRLVMEPSCSEEGSKEINKSTKQQPQPEHSYYQLPFDKTAVPYLHHAFQPGPSAQNITYQLQVNLSASVPPHFISPSSMTGRPTEATFNHTSPGKYFCLNDYYWSIIKNEESGSYVSHRSKIKAYK